MPRPSKLIVSTVSRSAAARGPTSSSAWNDTFEEIVSDFIKVFKQWNETVVPLAATLPIDAFSLGLSGKTCYVDPDASSSVAGTARYYNTTKKRPNTLKEQIDDTYRVNDAAILKFQSELAAVTNGLTETQKAAIGMRIFDANRASSATSLDGRTRLAELNLTQVAKDLYGSPPNLDGDGNPNLANSIKAMLTNLLALHNGTWDTDIALSHAGVIGSLLQTQVQSTSAFNDADPFTGSSAHLEQDLNRIRTRIRSILGTTSWITNITEPFASSGATSLQGVVNLKGTAARSTNNPWGYFWTDIGGLEARILATNKFVGQNNPTDESPVYSSTFYVTQNTNLEVAVSALDQALRDVSVAGQQLRRLETTLVAGQQVVTVNHNRNQYPITQAIFFDAGMHYSITHTSPNSFTFSGQFPVVNSGLIIALW